jgi:hypothetical protein
VSDLTNTVRGILKDRSSGRVNVVATMGRGRIKNWSSIQLDREDVFIQRRAEQFRFYLCILVEPGM